MPGRMITMQALVAQHMAQAYRDFPISPSILVLCRAVFGAIITRVFSGQIFYFSNCPTPLWMLQKRPALSPSQKHYGPFIISTLSGCSGIFRYCLNHLPAKTKYTV